MAVVTAMKAMKAMKVTAIVTVMERMETIATVQAVIRMATVMMLMPMPMTAMIQIAKTHRMDIAMKHQLLMTPGSAQWCWKSRIDHWISRVSTTC
mmetsp:Transcript_72751/g.115513  ORF Transcript_72751/g.115513 Transcript_72751/m.115513 type:complete len:95 (-) Transcript_72751:700-984(-)